MLAIKGSCRIFFAWYWCLIPNLFFKSFQIYLTCWSHCITFPDLIISDVCENISKYLQHNHTRLIKSSTSQASSNENLWTLGTPGGWWAVARFTESLDFKHFAGTLVSMQSLLDRRRHRNMDGWGQRYVYISIYLICLRELVKGTHIFWNKHGFLSRWNNNIH